MRVQSRSYRRVEVPSNQAVSTTSLSSPTALFAGSDQRCSLVRESLLIKVSVSARRSKMLCSDSLSRSLSNHMGDVNLPTSRKFSSRSYLIRYRNRN